MILFRSCLGCAIFTLHLFCIIGQPVHNLSFKLKSDKNQLFHRKTSYQEHDDSSEYVDKLLQTVSKDVSGGHENSSTLDNSLCRINNIYMIGNFNASVVKVGESSFRNDSEINKNKKSQIRTSKATECSTSEVNPTKIRMAEYFDKAGNTGKSTFILSHSTTMQTTENNLEITYHYPSKTKILKWKRSSVVSKRDKTEIKLCVNIGNDKYTVKLTNGPIRPTDVEYLLCGLSEDDLLDDSDRAARLRRQAVVHREEFLSMVHAIITKKEADEEDRR